MLARAKPVTGNAKSADCGPSSVIWFAHAVGTRPPSVGPQNTVSDGELVPTEVTVPASVAAVTVMLRASSPPTTAEPGGWVVTASRRMRSKCERPAPPARSMMRMPDPTAAGRLVVSNTSAGASAKVPAPIVEALKDPLARICPVLVARKYSDALPATVICALRLPTATVNVYLVLL